MVSIKDAKNGNYAEISGKRHYCEKLFTEEEEKKATNIANELKGLTIQEAELLLDKMKYYMLQSIFSP